MSGFSTAFLASSFKQEVLQGIHVLCGTVTSTGTPTNSSNHVTSLGTNMATLNVVPGMGVSGTAIPASSYVGFIDSTTSFYMSTNTGAVANATSSPGSETITFTGDACYVALGIATPTGTYNASNTNWGSSSGSPTVSNMGTDELAGSGGYTQGGLAIGVAGWSTPALSSAVAITQPSTNPSWTSATFSTSGCMIYKSSKQTRCLYVSGFGGTQTVAAGTFTILMPSNTSSTALIRIA